MLGMSLIHRSTIEHSLIQFTSLRVLMSHAPFCQLSVTVHIVMTYEVISETKQLKRQ